MKKSLTGVRAERQIDGAWVEVPAHLAHAWAAHVNGKLIGRYPKRAVATCHLNAAVQRSKKPGHGYSLGARMGERVRAVLTTSKGSAR